MTASLHFPLILGGPLVEMNNLVLLGCSSKSRVNLGNKCILSLIWFSRDTPNTGETQTPQLVETSNGSQLVTQPCWGDHGGLECCLKVFPGCGFAGVFLGLGYQAHSREREERNGL